MILNRSELLSKIALVKPCLSTQNQIPILSHLCFINKMIVAFNGAQGAVIPADHDLECGIPGDLLYRMLASYKLKETDVSMKADKVLFKMGKSSTVKFGTLPSSDFIFPPTNLPKKGGIPINKDLIDGLAKCLATVSQDPILQNQLGVVFTKNALYSTDNTRVSRYRFEEAFDALEDKQVLLPTIFCEVLIAFVRENKEFGEFFFKDDFVFVKFKECLVYSKLNTNIELIDFPEAIKSLVPNIRKVKGEDIPEGLDMILERGLILATNEITKVVDLTCEEGILLMETSTSIGKHRDKIRVSFEDFNFSVDIQYFKNLILSTKQIHFDDNTKVIVGLDGRYIQILASMQFEDEEETTDAVE